MCRVPLHVQTCVGASVPINRAVRAAHIHMSINASTDAYFHHTHLVQCKTLQFASELLSYTGT
eukprot:16316-Heterococcus_DN1.PRE.4